MSESSKREGERESVHTHTPAADETCSWYAKRGCWFSWAWAKSLHCLEHPNCPHLMDLHITLTVTPVRMRKGIGSYACAHV